MTTFAMGRFVTLRLALLAAVTVSGFVVAACTPNDPRERTLADFESFARVIQDPSGERHLVSVAAIRAAVPFPILIPSAIEADSIMVTAYVRPPWRRGIEPADSTYLAIEFRADAGTTLFVQHLGAMDVSDFFREPTAVYRPSSFDPARTAALLLAGGPATLTELPARIDDPVLVLQWSVCGHGLALAGLTSQYPEAELIRIAESVPERCE